MVVIGQDGAPPWADNGCGPPSPACLGIGQSTFPSRHTTTAAITAGLLVIAVSLRGPRGITSLRVVIGCRGGLVGLSRVRLGVHWFTDVIGGRLFAVGRLGVRLSAVARWLPTSFVSAPTPTAEYPTEDHAPENPGRRGRRCPA